MAYPRFQRSRDFKFFRRTTGDITLAHLTTWSDLTTIGTTWDITLAAETGDVIEATLSAVLDSAVVNSCFDVHTIVSGSALNSFATGAAVSNAGFGVSAWLGLASTTTKSAGPASYQVVSGDIVSGAVTMRLRHRGDAAVSRNFHGSVAFPLFFSCRNLGPVDPN